MTPTERLVALAEEVAVTFGRDPAPMDDSTRGIWVLISAATRLIEWGEVEVAEMVIEVADKHFRMLQDDN